MLRFSMAATGVALLSGCLSRSAPALTAEPAGMALDSLTFGNVPSEQNHQLTATQSEVVKGGLDEPARRLLPQNPQTWQGGTLAFTMKVDPAQPNYFTIRLWGDEDTPNRLILFGEGKQIGYLNEGDIDILDPGTEDRPYNGRFYYNTSPLPLDMTKGKTQLSFEIRSTGRIWTYGTTFEKYQHTMTEPSRGLYRVYTHTDGYFVPPATEKQGEAPANPPVRTEPGPEVLDALKTRVNAEVNKQLTIEKPSNQMLMLFLAKAYRVQWTPAYQNPKVTEQVVKFIDALFVAYRKNPKLAEAEPGTYNPDWFGFGPSGYAIALLTEPLRPRLDEDIDDGAGGKIKRRAAYAEMLVASRDWHRRHRRQYTNQSMINDLYGIYLCNRGVAVVDPAKALPEEQVRRYLYESVGLQPWLGNDTDTGSEKPLGDNYWQLTAKGLTKELGYVGYYGEVLDWVTKIYDATRPTPGEPGDARIKAQLARMAQARAFFRRPALDNAGHRAMRIETVIGWRDELHYPGDVTYVQRPNRDGSPLQAAAATLDPQLVGYAQQMLEDNQFFASVQHQMEEKAYRATIGMLDTPDEYELLKAQPSSPARLPMAPGQPDFVFTDEEDGVVALKNGDDILYVSLYWRAQYFINSLARVHYQTPRLDRTAVVRQDVQFEPSGLTHKRGTDINAPFAPWIPDYPPEIKSAHTGEEMPIAKLPPGIAFQPNRVSPYVGKADFYRLRYGPYLIGMNATKDKTFELGVSASTSARDLVSGKTLPLSDPIQVGPMSTVVLYLPGEITMKPFKTAATLAALAAVAATTATTAKAEVPVPLFAESFNAPGTAVELVNGARLGAAGSGVSGQPEDKAYVAAPEIGAATPGPAANLKTALSVGGLREATATLWYKPGAVQTPAVTLFSLGGLSLLPPRDDLKDGWTLRIEAERPQGTMYWFNSGKAGPHGPYSRSNEWQFVAFVWKGASNEVGFYQGTGTQSVKQGTVARNNAAAGGLIARKDTRWSETIGNSQQKYVRPFNGSIDNVRYFDKALDEAALESIRQADLQNKAP